MPGRLTTHVLDTTHGSPAADLQIELWALSDTAATQRTLLKTVRTNQDGRTDEPLLTGDALQAGTYELVFAVGDYFAQWADQTAAGSAAMRFLDRVPVRFSIANPDAHYHVPLLVTPWAYSTYRGS